MTSFNRRWMVVGAAASFATVLSFAAGQAQGSEAAGPDLSIGSAQFPDEDAVILRWEQHYTMEKDGTVRRRDHQWLKLLTRRPIRGKADPRVDYRIGEDELIIHTAQTILPDGTVMPVPDYSFNKTGPDDLAGWPEHIHWEQTVISYSGIVTDCVLELDYEIVTQPDVLPWLEGDLRLHDDYPTVERVVSVTVPADVAVNHHVEGISPDPKAVQSSIDGGMTQYKWTFKRLAGARGEPQSLPWQERCGRLRFTTCANAAEFVGGFVKVVDAAAKLGDGVKKFAEDAVENETDPGERARKVAKKLRSTFNFVNASRGHRSLKCRDAEAVLQSNYGTPLEAGALLAAAIRSLGLDATVEMGATRNGWLAEVPTNSAFAGMIVRVALPDGAVLLHPQHGEIKNPGDWGRHWLLGLDGAGGVTAEYVLGRGEEVTSEITIAGTISVCKAGKATGELRIALTGGFYDPAKLATAGKQASFVKGIVGRVLSDCKVTKHSITTLSDDVLKATVKVASKGILKELDKQRVLELGNGPAFLATYHLPLGRSSRKTEVHLSGAFREDVNLAIELPKGWHATITPAPLARVAGSWGAAEQSVSEKDGVVRFHRVIETQMDRITPADFASLRDAMNTLKCPASRLLVLSKR